MYQHNISEVMLLMSKENNNKLTYMEYEQYLFIKDKRPEISYNYKKLCEDKYDIVNEDINFKLWLINKDIIAIIARGNYVTYNEIFYDSDIEDFDNYFNKVKILSKLLNYEYFSFRHIFQSNNRILYTETYKYNNESIIIRDNNLYFYDDPISLLNKMNNIMREIEKRKKEILDEKIKIKNDIIKKNNIYLEFNETEEMQKKKIDKIKKKIDDEIKSSNEKLKLIKETIKEEENKLENIKDSKEEIKFCIVCTERKITTILTPCGHWCLCKECANKIGSKCPICKEIIYSKIKVYRP